MTELLTSNGIPPQVACALTPEQIRQVEIGLEEYVVSKRNRDVAGQIAARQKVLSPLVDITASVVDGFVVWGAQRIGEGYERFSYEHLQPGQTNLKSSQIPHSDAYDALRNLNESNILDLRVNIVSNTPSHFLDLTLLPDVQGILDFYSQKEGGYNSGLLDFARTENLVVNQKSWHATVFDFMTPHWSDGVSHDMWRFLAQSWRHIELPADWRERVASGNVPQLNLAINKRAPWALQPSHHPSLCTDEPDGHRSWLSRRLLPRRWNASSTSRRHEL
jgi:hypothetical protein